MKHSRNKIYVLVLLCNSLAVIADVHVAPFLQWRSQGRDTARKLVGTTSHHVYLDDMESFYGTFNVTPQYDRSFRSQEITQALFGSSLYDISQASDAANSSKASGRALVISGLETENRNNTKDWMAENFLLPRNFKSTITFSPLVQDFLVDFNLYVGLDEWVKGLYFRIYGPVVNNRTNLRAKETLIEPGTEAGNYTRGYFSPQSVVTTDQLFRSALQFFSGSPLIAPIDTITFTPLLFGKINPSRTHSKTGFAELRGEFGWNYLHEDYHFGFNIQSAAPTGKRPNGEFLLEPEIGNGKHWELGIGLSGHWTMWRSEDEEKHFDFIIEADITHLFNAKQRRTFDLIGKPNSRYMLAEKLVPIDTDSPNHLTGASGSAGVEFGNIYSPVANFSTRDIGVTIGVQGDIIAMLNYTSRGFSWDLGYNFWGMSQEKIHLSNKNSAFPERVWALKGDASIAGQSEGTGNPTILLAATESNANIHVGTNILGIGNPLSNPNIDSGIPATTGDMLPLTPVNVFDVTPLLPIFTSETPIFIQESDLDLESAELRGFSNKIYTHLSYTWIDREDWIPYLGIGFNAEFGSHKNNNDNGSINNNSSSGGGITFAISKWAVLMKGGVSFD
jgi:hypothetical protein